MAKPALPREHGSRRGYNEHRRRGEYPCTPCAVALATYTQAYRQRGRCAKGLGWPLEARRG